MKVRVKFEKTGPVKFVGHLDTMRYFQKAVRRAALPAAFSSGFSPHMIMSFASPLGVGVESTGDYFDMELVKEVPTREIAEKLNAVMAEGFAVVSVCQVEDGKAGKAMSLVAAADYDIRFREGKEPKALRERSLSEAVSAFLSCPVIEIHKETKKGEVLVDIRPRIFLMRAEGDGIFCRLASASADYTQPSAVMDAFVRFLGEEPLEYAYQVTRRELYAGNPEDGFVTLGALGSER